MPLWRTAISWQSIGTALALLIALGSAAFTGMQWHDAHRQVLFATKPHVDFDAESDPDEQPVGIAVINAGPGPAVVKSVTFYVDRKSVRDADEAGRDYAKLDESELSFFELEPGDSLAPGDKFWLIKYRKPRGGKIIRKNLENFADFVDQRLAVEIAYCSAFDEDLCWTKCSTKDRCK